MTGDQIPTSKPPQESNGPENPSAKLRYELKYDLRNPVQWERSWEQHYAAALDQIEWADQAGFATVHLHEHHFTDDGYLPSPFIMASAIAARTRRIRIALTVAVLPLKHPVQVAEDAAVLDILSGGRLDVAFAAGGGRPQEFEGYGVDLAQRSSLMDEGIEIIRRLWRGETVDWDTDNWQLRGARINPLPSQPGGPRLLIGGGSKAAARRAARLGTGYVPPKAASLEIWRTEMEALGRNPDDFVAFAMLPDLGPSSFLHVAHNPEEAWAALAPHAAHESNDYSKSGGGRSHYGAVSDPDELRRSGAYDVYTPAQTIDLARDLIDTTSYPRLMFHPMMGGMPIEMGQAGLDLVVDEVMAEVPPAPPEPVRRPDHS